jgi:predicted nucleic acid-binding protein
VSYVIDTNIISEVRKGSRCDANVAAWYSAIDDSELYLSTLVIGEIRKGIERARPRDAEKAEALERWLGEVTVAFDGRILLIDNAVSEEWGRMSAVRSIPIIDGLLAATAKANRMTLVTRNDADVDGLGAKLLNPFKPMNSAP